ncbi:MAG TPA: hypothetical protein VMI55_00100 [Thermoplasmata archaeon]|nr:hypothetical protein [Thermoplasmata archaeon]
MQENARPEHMGISSIVSQTGRALRRRIIASILAPVAWLSLTLLYVGFWAHGFSLFQSIIVVIVSILVLFAVMAVVWVSFGFREARRWWDWDT